MTDEGPIDAPRTFTAEEANELLPVVRPAAERMVEARQSLRQAQLRQAELRQRVGSNGGGISRAEVEGAAADVERALGSLREAVERLQRLGVVIKDLDRGLVDFPAVRGGEAVYLCWQVGEPEVAFWHGVDEGSAGRRPLD